MSTDGPPWQGSFCECHLPLALTSVAVDFYRCALQAFPTDEKNLREIPVFRNLNLLELYSHRQYFISLQKHEREQKVSYVPPTSTLHNSLLQSIWKFHFDSVSFLLTKYKELVQSG